MFLEQNQISTQLDIKDPFLMIDEIKIDLNQKKAKSSKILNKNDWFFACHMPTSPVMPATLQMEGMLQTLVLLIYNCSEKKISKSFIVDAKTKFYTKVFKQPMINYYAELKSENKELGFASVNIIWENEFNQKLGSTTAICKKII